MAATITPHPSSPSGPDEGYSPDDAQDQDLPHQVPPLAVISEMAGLLRDTRSSLLISAGMLSVITIGLALEAAFSARALRPGVTGAFNGALLCGLLACWLRALILLATAGRPVVNALSELRWMTGSPVDSGPRWLTLPPLGANPEEWTWIRAHLLVGAARLARYRLQRADIWTYVTAAGFLAWTAVILLGL